MGDGSHEAGDVARAAGASEPRLPFVLPHAFQRVVVEEAVAAQRHAGEYAVVEGAFHHVVVFGGAGGEEHAVVPVDVGDGRAGLAIGRVVVQLVVRPEAFALGAGADAAGDVKLAPGHVLPDAGEGMVVGGVARQGGHVGHAGIEVAGPHGVSHNLVLL